MQKIVRSQENGNIVLHTILVVLVIAVVTLVGVGVKRRHDRQVNQVASVVTTQSQATTLNQSTASSQATISTGTDNTSLNNDLNVFSGSLSQNNQNLQTASSSTNDQQQQVAVPSN